MPNNSQIQSQGITRAIDMPEEIPISPVNPEPERVPHPPESIGQPRTNPLVPLTVITPKITRIIMRTQIIHPQKYPIT